MVNPRSKKRIKWPFFPLLAKQAILLEECVRETQRKLDLIQADDFGCFLKWSFGFPTKNDHFEVFLWLPPFKEAPISVGSHSFPSEKRILTSFHWTYGWGGSLFHTTLFLGNATYGPKQFFLVSKSSKKWPNHLDWWNYGETYLLQSTKWIEIRISTEVNVFVFPRGRIELIPNHSDQNCYHHIGMSHAEFQSSWVPDREAGSQTDTFLFINGTMCNTYHYYCWWLKSCTSWYGSLSH